MNKIVLIDGVPIVHVAGRCFLLAMRHGVPFMVENSSALRKTERAIDLLCDTGFDDLLRSTEMFTVILRSSKMPFSMHMGRGRTSVAFFEEKFLTGHTLKMCASGLVHEATHIKQWRERCGWSFEKNEVDACHAQIDFLHYVEGCREIECIEHFFKTQNFWWVRDTREEAAWQRWIVQNELILYGLKELKIIQ